jgi:indole-3-glycerol phosphate synthase
MNIQATTDRPDLLDTIVAATRRTIELRKAREPLAALEQRAAAVDVRPGAFRRALSRPGHLNVIAESKRRSPAKGLLRLDYQPAALASAYDRAGASALSVLTEPSFFDGALEHLAAARRASTLPLLRKDFIVDQYQVLESRANGADALLLIASALDDDTLVELLAATRAHGLDALVEVHDETELARALDCGATIIGVNSRNLRTLEVDLGVVRTIAPRIPRHVTAVAESGIRSGRDLAELHAAGYSAFLIGERLVTSADPAAALAAMITEAGRASGTGGAGGAA